MKAIRTTFFAAAIAATAALTASAQTPAQPRPAAPSAGAAIAEGKFALIDTEAFGDQKEGIKRLVAAFQTVEREFKPRRDDITALRTRYDALLKDIDAT